MPPITDNNGSTFYNINYNKSFVQIVTTGLVPLSSYGCSEVTVVNRGENVAYLYDNNNFSDANYFVLSASESYTLKGVSNTNSVSAKAATGSTTLNYRASRFSAHN